MLTSRPSRAARPAGLEADETVLLVALLLRVGAPVHLVVALRGEDAARDAPRTHLADERVEGAADLVRVARVHVHFDGQRTIARVLPQPEELDRATAAGTAATLAVIAAATSSVVQRRGRLGDSRAKRPSSRPRLPAVLRWQRRVACGDIHIRVTRTRRTRQRPASLGRHVDETIAWVAVATPVRPAVHLAGEIPVIVAPPDASARHLDRLRRLPTAVDATLAGWREDVDLVLVAGRRRAVLRCELELKALEGAVLEVAPAWVDGEGHVPALLADAP
mmetsp:Transcript_39459/g.104148  ORF Transcript_39459/g.104148 Transcript_39459/m.104148 type:complete len:277 (-) Transcript_39459:236-1066(-)